MCWFWIILFIVILALLAYKHAALSVYTISVGIYLLFLTKFSDLHWLVLTVYWIAFAAIAAGLNLRPIRRQLITRHIFFIYKKIMPKMSKTEAEALAAGTVDWDGEIFTGKPNWDKLLAYPKPQLSAEEQAFIDGPVEQFCQMISDWDITHRRLDLAPEAWQFLKANKFFAMIIPKKYGGLEFSALAHSAVIVKIASRSVSAATCVGVPNSLGPAELLLEYGTDQQKEYYLPRLARGEEIPCFALTGPEVGSDASAMPDDGVICEGEFQGKKIIGIRLNWNKRYITLAPIATILGLAFKLYDPDHLIGDQTALGITCALIPTNTPGVAIGHRHFPLNAAFQNGPTQGKDVFVPLDYIIGGIDMAGKGWKMLIECLSTGRAISLPSTVMGGAKVAAYTTGVYSHIRTQFNLPVGKFEGVQEALARIAGHVYTIDAERIFAISAIDRGEKPAVPSGISKYHCTELARKVANDGMDVLGGKGIMLGPKNFAGRGYQELPIAITVEGANILTRSMVIFGQGAIRCHPFVLKEMQAASHPDQQIGLIEFDQGLFAHIGFFISNAVKSLILGLTQGRMAGCPKGPLKRYYQQLTRFSAVLGFATDVAMLKLGGDLKRREHLSARLGDVLSYLYIGSAVIKHYHDQGEPTADLPLVKWSLQNILYLLQQSLDGFIHNFPSMPAKILMRVLTLPLGKRICPPSDRLSDEVAMLIFHPTETRDRLAAGAFLTPGEDNPVGQMNIVLAKVLATADLEKKIMQFKREEKIQGFLLPDLFQDAFNKGLITEVEKTALLDAYDARMSVINVDDFDPKEFAAR